MSYQPYVWAVSVKIVAFRIDDDCHRHILHCKPAQRLGAEVLPCDDLGLLNRSRNQRAGTAYRGEVHGAALFHRGDYFVTAIPFPIMPRRPFLMRHGVYGSILDDVVGPAEPKARPALAGDGPT